jgi:hypothetical protein
VKEEERNTNGLHCEAGDTLLLSCSLPEARRGSKLHFLAANICSLSFKPQFSFTFKQSSSHKRKPEKINLSHQFAQYTKDTTSQNFEAAQNSLAWPVPRISNPNSGIFEPRPFCASHSHSTSRTNKLSR